MNILVTGGAGFIGSNLVKKLISLSHNIVVIDNLSTGYKKNIPPEVDFIKGDLSNINLIDELEDYNIDFVFHIAGQSSGQISFEKPLVDLDYNVKSTLNLLDFMKKSDLTKIVFASSMSVYGNKNSFPVKETDLLEPISHYGISKLTSEAYLNLYSNLNFSCISMRLFNIYGPNQNLSNLKQGMLSIFLSQALNSEKIIVKGSLDRFRDFVYIDDCIDALLKSFNYLNNNQKPVHHKLNICNSYPVYVKDMVNEINSRFNFKKKIVINNSTPNDQFGIYGCNKNAKKLLNWEPIYDFKNGLDLIFKYYEI